MNWGEARNAFNEAKTTMQGADQIAGDMAILLVGRLRKQVTNEWTLTQLKRELRGFNMHTKTWRD